MPRQWSLQRARALTGQLSTALMLICVAPLQSCVVQATESSPADIYEVPATIDATGTNDVTTDLLAFFASVPDGSTIKFPAGAVYRCENTLLLKGRNNLTFDGNGATLIANTDGSGVTPDPVIRGTTGSPWPIKRRHLMFYGGRQIILKNLTIRGAHPNGGNYVGAYEGQHGIEMTGVVGGEIAGVTVTDVYGDYLYFGGLSGTYTSNVWVHDNTFARNGRQGIAITAAQDMLIENNQFSQGARAILDIEPNSAGGGAKRVTFRNNAVGWSNLNFFSNTGSGGAVIEDILIEGNTLYDKVMTVVVGSATIPHGLRKRYTIRNNVSTNRMQQGNPMMAIYHVDGLVVTGNSALLDSTRNVTAVRATYSCNVVVTGNQFQGAATEVDTTLPYTC